MRLSELRTLEARAWRDAIEKNSLSAFENFLAEWTEGFFYKNASEKALALRAIRVEWEQLQSSDDEKLLEIFVTRHGWSEFGATAAARLIALRRERAQPNKDDIKTLTARDLLTAIDGAEVRFVRTGETVTFDTKSMPPFRSAVGRNYLTSIMNVDSIANEGAFTALAGKGNSGRKIEGLGGIVDNPVHKTGVLFLMQMHGTERSPQDVTKKDRLILTMEIVYDGFGHVCMTAPWHSLKVPGTPKKTSERCVIERK